MIIFINNSFFTIIYLLVIVFLLSFVAICFAQKPIKPLLKDGLYLISKIDTNSTQLSLLTSKEAAIFFSKMFDEYNSEGYMRIVIDTSDYVPLELDKSPIAEQQTESKKKLLLSLTSEASEKLKSFTTKNVMKRVVLVVDGEALTMHKIKEPLTSGLLQITRCNDNACELLFVKLKDNVK